MSTVPASLSFEEVLLVGLACRNSMPALNNAALCSLNLSRPHEFNFIT